MGSDLRDGIHQPLNEPRRSDGHIHRLPRMNRVALLALTLSLVLASSASAFRAHGSVEQVYATGLKANAPVTLLSGAGRTLATQHADSLGGALFRNVKPGAGY